MSSRGCSLASGPCPRTTWSPGYFVSGDGLRVSTCCPQCFHLATAREVDPAGHLRQLRDWVGALARVPTALHGKLLRQSSFPASLARTPFVFIHRDGKKKPLQTKGSNKQGCPRSTDNFSFRASESDAPIGANIQGSEERVKGNWLRDSRPLHLDRGGRPNTYFWMRRTVSRRDAVDAAADQPPRLLIGDYTTNTLHRSLPGSRARGQDLHHRLQRQGGDCQHRPPQTGPHGLRGPGPGGPASTTGPTTSRTDAYTSRTGTSTSNQSARRALLPPQPNRPRSGRAVRRPRGLNLYVGL